MLKTVKCPVDGDMMSQQHCKGCQFYNKCWETLSLEDMQNIILKAQRSVEDYYFSNKPSLSQEQKTELNELYYALQQAEQNLQKFHKVSEKHAIHR